MLGIIYYLPAVNFLYDSRMASTPGQMTGEAGFFFLTMVRSSGSVLISAL